MKKGKKLTKKRKRKRKTKSKTKRKDSCNSCKSNKYNSNNNYRLGALALAKEEEIIRLILDQQRAFADDFLNFKKRRSSKKTAHVDIISLEIIETGQLFR